MRLFGRGRSNPSPDGTMTLMEHLHELRRRMFYAVLALLLGTIIGFVWFSHGIPAIHLSSLGDILTGPYCSVSPKYRATLGGTDGCQLLATTPFQPIMLQMKAAIMAGAVLTSPVWLNQIWSFITPALYDKERKFARIFTGAAAVLFVIGAVLAYIVIAKGLEVLLSFGGGRIISALDPDSYFSFLITLLVVFGVSFELPLLLIMLNAVGVVSGAKLAAWRRYSIFGMVIFAALVVPGNDPFTMSALAVALVVLYEVSVQVAKAHDKRKAKRIVAAGFGEIDDDTASALPDPAEFFAGAPSPAPEPVAPAGPVDDHAFEPGPPTVRRTDFGDAT